MNKTIRVFTYTLAARSSLARSYGSPARRSRPAHGLTLRTKWLQNNTITHSASGPRRPAHERDDPSLPGAAMLFSHFFFLIPLIHFPRPGSSRLSLAVCTTTLDRLALVFSTLSGSIATSRAGGVGEKRGFRPARYKSIQTSGKNRLQRVPVFILLTGTITPVFHPCTAAFCPLPFFSLPRAPSLCLLLLFFFFKPYG